MEKQNSSAIETIKELQDEFDAFKSEIRKNDLILKSQVKLLATYDSVQDLEHKILLLPTKELVKQDIELVNEVI